MQSLKLRSACHGRTFKFLSLVKIFPSLLISMMLDLSGHVDFQCSSWHLSNLFILQSFYAVLVVVF